MPAYRVEWNEADERGARCRHAVVVAETMPKAVEAFLTHYKAAEGKTMGERVTVEPCSDPVILDDCLDCGLQ